MRWIAPSATPADDFGGGSDFGADERELDEALPGIEVRVLVVDDDPLAARALRRRLEPAGATVVAEAVTFATSLELARRHAPDVAFIGVLRPTRPTVAVIASLAALDLGIRPILLTLGSDADDGLAAIRAGARGYMCKADFLTCDLPRLLHAVMGDELVCSRSMATAIVDRLVQSPALGAGYRPVRSPLTSREWEVLDLLCTGQSTDAIARELVISIETVRTHVKHMMRKLGAVSRAEVIAMTSALRVEATPPTA